MSVLEFQNIVGTDLEINLHPVHQEKDHSHDHQARKAAITDFGDQFRSDWIINDVSSDKLDEQKRVHQEVEDEEPDDGFTQKTRLIKLNVAEVKGLCPKANNE